MGIDGETPSGKISIEAKGRYENIYKKGKKESRNGKR